MTNPEDGKFFEEVDCKKDEPVKTRLEDFIANSIHYRALKKLSRAIDLQDIRDELAEIEFEAEKHTNSYLMESLENLEANKETAPFFFAALQVLRKRLGIKD